jgi:alpha-galactosidase
MKFIKKTSAISLLVIAVFGMNCFSCRSEAAVNVSRTDSRTELDFPEGSIGGHSPTAVQWTAPKDLVVSIAGVVWKLRNNSDASLSLWIKGTEFIHAFPIPPQSGMCNSKSPKSFLTMVTEQGGNPNGLNEVSFKTGEQIIVLLGGNDFTGIDLSIKSKDEEWSLSKNFDNQTNPNGEWVYGQNESAADAPPHLVPYDQLIESFDPDGKALFGAAQSAWIGSTFPAHLSLMKSRGTSPQKCELRFTSGDEIFVESLLAGKWVNRHWGSDGHINVPYDRWMEESFSVEVNGEVCSGEWKLVSVSEEPSVEVGQKHSIVQLSNSTCKVSLKIHTVLDGTPIITRWLEMTNESDAQMPVTGLNPWLGILTSNSQFWGNAEPPKRFETPFSLGYFTNPDHCWEGWFDWKPVEEGVTQFGCDKGQCYDDPFFVIRNQGTGQLLIGELGWSGNWRMELNFTREGRDTVRVKVGPWASDPLIVLAPGETFNSPAMHMGTVTGDLDKAIQAMHQHVRGSVIPKRPEDRSYLIQYAVPGDQGYLSERFGDPAGYTEESVLRNVEIASAIGTELFIMDAGWWENQGDWEPSKNRFPRGLDPIVEAIHAKGMLFGIYGEVEKAGPMSKLAKEHPDWIEWHAPYPVLNLSKPEVASYLEETLSGMIERLHLDLFRLDFNTPSAERFEGKPNDRNGLAENNFLRYYDNFYSIFARIHAKYPKLILQQAACGGGRNDLGTAGRFHEEYLTDGLRVPYVVQNYCGQTMVLPPECLIIAIGADGGGSGGNAEDFQTYLRVTYTLSTPWVFFGMTAPDMSLLTPERREEFLRYAGIYKNFIRPLWPTSQVFHHAPISAQGGVDSSCWFAQEYSAPDGTKGWAVIIKIKDSTEMAYMLHPKGVRPEKSYKVTLDNQSSSVVIDGFRLQQEGIRIPLEAIGSSELILIEETGKPK